MAPYRPTKWTLGGTPTARIDIPITAALLLLYILGAIINMSRFQMNNKRGHKFIFSVLLFGFCMFRIFTTILRITSIAVPQNIRLAIAAQIFISAGVILVFVINLFWTLRIVRSLHPRIGWHPLSMTLLKVLIILIILTLLLGITVTVQSFYTLRPRTKQIDRDCLLYVQTFFAIVSFLPVPIITLSVLGNTYWSLAECRSKALVDGFMITFALPQTKPPEKFGHGRIRTKIVILLTGSTLLCLGAAYRCGTTWLPPIPKTEPLPSCFHRANFYIFNFVVEILVVYLYAIVRVDLRFYVPDGCHGNFEPPAPIQNPLVDDIEKGSPRSALNSPQQTQIQASTHTYPSTPPASSPMDITALPPIPTLPLSPVPQITSSSRTSKSSVVGKSGKQAKKPVSARAETPDTAEKPKKPTRAEKKEWRKSEQERIIKRLGGPWEKLDE